MFVRIFALSWMAYCGYYFCRKNFSVLMPFLKAEQGYSSDDLATVLLIYSVAYAAGQVIMGGAADRWGARLVVAGGAVVSAGCSALTGTVFPLGVAQGMNGLAQASGWPGVLKMTREWFPQANRGVVMAWWGTHLVAGGFLATNFAAWATREDWRRGAWLPALLLVAVGLIFGVFARDGEARVECPGEGKPRSGLPLNRLLAAIATMYFFVKMARYSFLFWLPLYMTERLAYSPQAAGYTSSMFEVTGFCGALAAGYASERMFRGARFVVGALMMTVLGVSCFLYPLLSGLGMWANLAGVALIGAFTFGPDTLMAGAATQESVAPEATARAAGFVNGVGSVGQVVSPVLVAGVSARLGWDALFYALGVMALAGAGALATQWREEKRCRQ